jgi:dihydrofolate reductase
MRRVRYAVAMSLDGYIAGPNCEADWITTDPDINFASMLSQFDTILVGRMTLDGMVAASGASMPGMRTFVFLRSLCRYSADWKHQDDANYAYEAPGSRLPGRAITLFNTCHDPVLNFTGS